MSGAERFMIKAGNFASIFPSVAAPALGGYAGRVIGQRYHASDIGMLLGGITGGTAGQLIKEKVENGRNIPAGAPYALDPSDQDIPAWALQGAQMLQPQMKQGGHEHESMADVVLGEVPGANPLIEGVKHGPRAAGRAFGGMTLGGVGGGLAGTLGAKGIEHLVGHAVRVPGLNMPLSDLLGSVGGAIGATKGLRYMQSS
jgi:hypothetical protein